MFSGPLREGSGRGKNNFVLPQVGFWRVSLQPLQWENKQGEVLLTQEGWPLSLSPTAQCDLQAP